MTAEIPTELNELTKLFRELGARTPESWAASQIQEGIPQLYRFLFLRQAWARITPDLDNSWIERAISQARARPDAPFAGLGASLERCLEKGVSESDLTEIARCKEVQLLLALCYLMEDPGLDSVPECIEELSWGLFPSEDSTPVGRQIAGLHESVLSMDPTGLEMRPRNV